MTDHTMVAVTITAVFPADLHHQFAHQYHQAAAGVLAPVQDLQVVDSLPVVAQDLRVADSVLAAEAQDLQAAVPSVVVADHQ